MKVLVSFCYEGQGCICQPVVQGDERSVEDDRQQEQRQLEGRLNRLSSLGRRADRGLNSLGEHGYWRRYNRWRRRSRLIDWGLSDLRWLRVLCNAEPGLFRLDKPNILFLNGF